MAACVAIAAFGLLLQKLGQGSVGLLAKQAGAGGAVLVALAALFDAFSRRHPPAPQFERHLPHQFAQGRAHTVEITVSPPNQGLWRQPQQLMLADHAPADWECSPPLLHVDTLPGRISIARYQASRATAAAPTFPTSNTGCPAPSDFGSAATAPNCPRKSTCCPISAAFSAPI